MKQIFILLVTIFCLSFSASEKHVTPNNGVKKGFLSNLEQLSNSCLELSNKNQIDQKDYLSLRSEFKKIEFLLAQIDHSFYLKNINGAPLPKLEKNVPDISVIEPHGFQVLDELMAQHQDSFVIEKSSELKHLYTSLNQAKSFTSNISFSNELLLHAFQNELLRIYTLGITGFDTPGSLNGVTDASQSLSGLLEFSEISELDSLGILQHLLKRNIQYLDDNPNFESFDRAIYYIEFWQPLYSELIDLYSKNECRTWNKAELKPLEVNASEKHLFNQTFFNKQAFIDFNINEINSETIKLGKALFYEKKLSKNSELSCASCHNPKKGFSDGRKRSISSDGETTLLRNSSGLINSMFTKAFFYDLRAEHLSQQFEHVIFNTYEFNTTLLSIFKDLDSFGYTTQFKKAFPAHSKDPINPYTFKVALSAYISSLTKYDSKFDKFMRKESVLFDSSVIKGYNLFMGKAACATCHFPPNFSGLVPPYFNDSETEILGVPQDTTYGKLDPDLGRYSEKKPKDMVDFYRHSFKTTTVRNISLTSPYMHNGVFKTLEQVLEFYDNGGGVGHGLKIRNQTLSSDSLSLTDQEKSDIITFMENLEENWSNDY